MDLFLLQIVLEKEYIICSVVAFHVKSQLLLHVPYLNKANVFDNLYKYFLFFSKIKNPWEIGFVKNYYFANDSSIYTSRIFF
jgi:hypothetical protein